MKRFAASCFTILLPKPDGSKEKHLAAPFVFLLMRKSCPALLSFLLNSVFPQKDTDWVLNPWPG